MANLLIILCLVIGLYYSNAVPIPTPYYKQKEIKPESELIWDELWDVIPIPWTDASWVESL